MSADVALTWRSLGELAKECAALPAEAFCQRFDSPFLLELNPDSPDVASGETRSLSGSVEAADAPPPSLEGSLIVNLGAGEHFILGRGDDADLKVPHETVSDRHCAFERIGTLWSVRDLESTNGTYLNGKRLGSGEQLPLKFGTKLMLGEAQFLFLGLEDCHELLQELIKEPRIRPRSLGKYRADFRQVDGTDEIRQKFPGPFLVVQAPTGRSAAAPAGPVSSNTITLTAEQLKKSVNKNVSDAVFNLENHQMVRIGRATVTQIHLPLPAISNLHAALIRDGDRWFVQDLGAKNGTYVWGERLEQDRRELESGAEINLGNIKSIFFGVDDFITYAAHRDTLV